MFIVAVVTLMEKATLLKKSNLYVCHHFFLLSPFGLWFSVKYLVMINFEDLVWLEKPLPLFKDVLLEWLAAKIL